MCPDGDREADARLKVNRFCALALSSPHLAGSAEYVPDLFDGAVRYSPRDGVGRQFEMCHSAAVQLQENTNVGAIWGDSVAFGRKHHRREYLRQGSSIEVASLSAFARVVPPTVSR